jgi:hypothetical protein
MSELDMDNAGNILHNGRAGNITIELVDVSPALAQAWLNLNHDENRRIKKARVSQYARTMRAGGWMPTTETIKFDSLGQLMDGQHRLLAVISAGVTVPMFVARNLPPSTFHVLDHIGPRTVLWWVDNGFLRSTAVAMATQIGGTKVRVEGAWPTEDEMSAFWERHHTAITWSVERMPRQSGITARERAAVARAYYHVGHELLADFCDCLYMRQVADTSRRQLTIMKARDVTMGVSGHDHGALRPASPRAKYLKVERAITAYVKDESITRLFEAPKEMFPIPEDNWDNLGEQS